MATALSAKDAAAVKKAATAGGLSSSAGSSIVKASNSSGGPKVINTNTGATQNYTDYVATLPKPQTYTPPASITSDALASQGAVAMPPPPPEPNYLGALASAQSTVKAPSIYDVKGDTGSSDPNQFNLKMIQDLMTQESKITPPNTAAIYSQQEQQAGIAQKQQQVNDLTAQLNAITAKSQADQLRVTGQGRGIPEAIIGGQQAQIAKEAAIESLPVAAQLAAAQGNLETAQQHVQTYAKLLIADAQARYEHKLDVFKTITPFLTAAENRRLDVLDQKNKQTRDDAVTLAKAKAEALSFAIQNGAPSSVRNAITSATDLVGVTAAADRYGVNPLTAAQIRSTNALATQRSDGGGGGGTGGGTDPSVEYYTQLLAEGKITVANVPQSIRNAVVTATQGNVNSKLPEGAITKINDTTFALSSLSDLRAKISANSDMIGPITGLGALNPYSKQRQVQADIDRIRQTVGKALEGGVLRKEDEEKYKKILATITDTPETAIYKIDALISSIQGNIDNYKALQSQSGYYIANPTAAPEDLRSKYNY